MNRAAAAVLTVLALTGCGVTGLRGGGDPVAADARNALAAMAAEYQGGQTEDFFERFDHRNFPNYEAFREKTSDFLLHNRQLTVDIIVDAVVQEDRTVSIQAHWNRSFVDEQGAHKLEEGRCEFVLRRRASGGLALLFIHGDSPF